jgi:hypothetical protein
MERTPSAFFQQGIDIRIHKPRDICLDDSSFGLCLRVYLIPAISSNTIEDCRLILAGAGSNAPVSHRLAFF